VFDGTAYLHGTVETNWQKKQAARLLYDIQGLTAINNRIEVTGISDRPLASYTERDQWLEREIYNQLYWSPFIRADKLTVVVKNGIATLMGEVPSWQQKREAINQTYDAGANAVIDELKIEIPRATDEMLPKPIEQSGR
ncbi:MAG: BON domain-containing protein, partial [Bacteroidota bacterium]